MRLQSDQPLLFKDQVQCPSVWNKESCEEPRSPQQEKYARIGTALATGAWLELCVSLRSALDISALF